MEGKKSAMASGFSIVNEDIVQNILSRLPALSFAFATCVNKSWNKVCSQILSRPLLASALSLNPSLPVAVKEVLEKVLSKPIRPHFAIACIGRKFSLEATHSLITEGLGSKVPIITNAASGIIGADALTDELKEVKWKLLDEHDTDYQPHDLLDRGIVLMVGFLPGVKVDAIPLLRPKQEPQFSWINQFVMNIKSYTTSVSDSASPDGIILFGDKNIDMKPILATMDWAMPEDTVIVGDASGCFLCNGGNSSRHYPADSYSLDAVALVFAKDKNKPNGVGEIEFHITLSTGIIPFGPRLQAVCVVSRNSEFSWLTAKMEEQFIILDGQGLLDDLNNQFEDESPDIYIGVMRQRVFSDSPEHLRPGMSLAFYEVLGGENQFVVVNGVGIRPGDSFLFYHSDSETACSSIDNACKNLALLKDGSERQDCQCSDDVPSSSGKKEVLGGFIFSCNLRGGQSFLDQPNADSFPITENFPGVPVAGVYCNGEIGRGSARTMSQDDDDENAPRCCLCVYSTVYLVMTYVPAISE